MSMTENRQQPDIVQRSTLEQIVAACGNDTGFWSGRDFTAAGMLMERYTAQELQRLASRASILVGYDTAFPIEMWDAR